MTKLSQFWVSFLRFLYSDTMWLLVSCGILWKESMHKQEYLHRYLNALFIYMQWSAIVHASLFTCFLLRINLGDRSTLVHVALPHLLQGCYYQFFSSSLLKDANISRILSRQTSHWSDLSMKPCWWHMGNEDLGRCPGRTPSLVVKHGAGGWPDPYAASQTIGSILNILRFPLLWPRPEKLPKSTLSRAGKWCRSNYPSCTSLPRCCSFVRLTPPNTMKQ